MRYEKVILSVLALAAVALYGVDARAQISGKLVNPNVLLVIDSSGSMDWLSENPESATLSWAEAEDECERANTVDMTEKRTSWQQLQDVMLGDISSTDFHCFNESYHIRPGINYGTVQSDVGYNISEYSSSARNHYRAISCKDERADGSRGNWNTEYSQCIGEDLTPTIHCSDGSSASITAHTTERGHICWEWVDYDGDCDQDENELNYVPASGNDPEICYNYHPLAEDRPANGILERYRTLARFGIMTYDNKPKPLSTAGDPHRGLFDYGQSRQWNCHKWTDNTAVPGNTRCTWNAGARADNENAVGGMVPISDDLDNSNAAVREVLDTSEPLYCSPVGALLDDVGYYYANDPRVGPAMTVGDLSGGKDLFFNCRPKLVIFISDGEPTPTFEFPQDVCDANPPVGPLETESTDPYACPWNSSLTEVTEIAELVPDLPDVEPIYTIVIGLNVADKEGAANRCAAAPTWSEVAQPGGLCIPPADDCVQVQKFENQVDCETGADGFLTPRQFLNNLAMAGWPDTWELQPPWREDPMPVDFTLCDDLNACGGEEDTDPKGAIFVDSADELSAVLDLILSMFTASTGTRTEIATTNQVSGNLDESQWTGSAADPDAVAQYEFNSGFEVLGGLPWRGYLYRQGYSCQVDGEGGTVDDLEYFHDLLKTQASAGQRRIYTISDEKLGAISVPYSEEGLERGFAASSYLQEIKPGSGIDDCDIGGPTQDNVCDGTTSILTQLKTHLYGDAGSARADHPLADIYNSTPTILSPPLERLPIPSYQNFKTLSYALEEGGDEKYIERPPTLYVGTSDGVLHSFNVWGPDSAETESKPENWGFVPNKLLDSIYRQYPLSWEVSYDEDTGAATTYTVPEIDQQFGLYQHIYGVDGSPVSADVRLWRNPDAVSGGDYDESALWRSLLLGGLGKGGSGYYCLDVTENPKAPPRFRWEISSKSVGNNEPGAFNNPDGTFGLGLTLARPALAYVYLNGVIPGSDAATVETDHEEAVAILPGGFINDENGGPEVSTSVYIVRAADGNLIKALHPVNDNCADLDDDEMERMVAQLVGEPAIPGGGIRSATITDEAFIGDDRGRLWRIDMSDKDPEEWCLDMFFDTLLSTHYTQKDCLDGDEACCDEKVVDPTSTCSSEMIDLFASDDALGIEECSGQACVSVDYPFPRIPVMNAPTIVQDENRNNIIIFGTGQIDNLESLDHNRIFSLTERIQYTVGTPGTASTTERVVPELNWWLGEEIPDGAPVPEDDVLALQATAMPGKRISSDIVWSTDLGVLPFNLGEKLLGKPVIFDGVAYFTTFVPMNVSDLSSLDACESGGAKIWGVNYTDPSDFKKLAWEEDSIAHTEAYKEYPGELLTGVKVVRRPSCSGEAAFQLVAQKVTPEDEGGSTTGEPPKVTSESLTLKPRTNSFTTVVIDSWSLVFN